MQDSGLDDIGEHGHDIFFISMYGVTHRLIKSIYSTSTLHKTMG